MCVRGTLGSSIYWWKDNHGCALPRGYPVRIWGKFTLEGDRALPEGRVPRFPVNNAETRRRGLTPLHPHPTPSGIPDPTLNRPAPRQCPRPQRSGALARALPSSARRCFRRVNTSFLGSSTFWVDFFTSPWLLRENIPPREAWSPPAGQEAPAPRESLHRVGAGACRASHSPPPSRPPPLPLKLWLQEGGAGTPPRGEGQEGGVNAKPTAPPHGRCQPTPRALRTCARFLLLAGTRLERRACAANHKEACPTYTLYYKSRDAPR